MKCSVVDLGFVSYREALELQRRSVADRQRSAGSDILYLLEHPPVLTLGRNADGSSLLVPRDTLRKRAVELVETDRGGDITFHGPGQLVGYPILALEESRRDIRRYVDDLEEVLIGTLDECGITARRNDGHRGVWTENGKIASIGVRIARWVTSHGFALNVSTDLSYFSLITPCGIPGCRMTSMERETGAPVAMDRVKRILADHFSRVFERTMVELPPAATGAGER